MSTSRVRLWVRQGSAWDYVTINMAQTDPLDSKPWRDGLDGEGLEYTVALPSAKRRVNRVPFTFCTRHVLDRNSLDTLCFADWLETHVRDTWDQMFLYCEGYGTDSDGTAWTRRKWYRGRLMEIPGAVLGLLAFLGGAPHYVRLELKCDHPETPSAGDGAEGTFTNFNDPPSFFIVDADTALDRFKIAGDRTALFLANQAFYVINSTLNDGGPYVCDADSTYVAPNTTIQVRAPGVPDGTDDGEILNPQLVVRL